MSYRVITKREAAHDDGIWCIRWTRDNHLVTGSVDETLRIWDAGNLTQPQHVFGGTADHQLAVVSVDVTLDSGQAATTSMDGMIRIYDLHKGERIRMIHAGAMEAWTCAYHPAATKISSPTSLLATGTHKGEIHLWDVSTGEKRQTYDSECKFVMSVAFSPDGTSLAVGGFDGVVQMYDVETGKATAKLAGHSRAVRSLTFTSDSSHLITVSDDQHINMYESKAGQQVSSLHESLSGHQSWIVSVAASPDGKQFATGSSDKKIKLWDFATRECLHTFDAHSQQVWGLAYSPDGTQLASVSDDASIVIFSTNTSKPE